MAVLKRIKAATLMETMVATVLIIIIFMMASLLMESVFADKIRGNTETITEKINFLEYQYTRQMIPVPYFEAWESWEIEITKTVVQGTAMIQFQAKNTEYPKEVESYMIPKYATP